MGHGAPKRMTSVVSIGQMTSILAAEANADEAFKDLAKVLEKVFSGEDSPHIWNLVSQKKQTLEYRTRVLYGEIDKMIRSQERG